MFIVSCSSSLNITSRSVILGQKNTISASQLGGAVGVGGCDGGVEDTEEPDDEADNVLRVKSWMIFLRILTISISGVVGREAGFAVQELGAVDRGPGEVHDVQGDHGALEQAGLGHVLLDLGQDGDDREDDAEQHVEADEELVQFALAGEVSGVVDIHEDDGRDGPGEHEAGEGEESCQPAFAFVFLIVSIPSFSPTVGKVNDQNKLDEDEQEASNEAKPHPNCSKRSIRNPEGCNHASDDDQILDSPETILNSSSWIIGGLDTDHEDAHDDKEEGDNQT